MSNIEKAILESIRDLHPGHTYAIWKKTEELLGYSISVGTLHTVLESLEDQDIVRSYEGEVRTERGNRRRKYYLLR